MNFNVLNSNFKSHSSSVTKEPGNFKFSYGFEFRISSFTQVVLLKAPNYVSLIMVDMPWPTPMHIVARPRPVLRLFIS